VLQFPYRIHGLCRPARPLLPAAVREWFGRVLIGILVVSWLFGMMKHEM
jgi:hypothetical protein